MSDWLEFMEDPMDRFDEFVTAAPLNPGQNPLLKPDKACSGQTPLNQTCKCAEGAFGGRKLFLRKRSRGGCCVHEARRRGRLLD